MLAENKLSLPKKELHEFIRSRQSMRRFENRPVSAAQINQILETAVRAPSAHNRQPWRFAILYSPESRSQLGMAMGQDFGRALSSEGLSEVEIQAQVSRSRRRIEEAPAAIVLCMDLSDMETYADIRRSDGERAMAMQSVALAGGHLLLAAHAEGLGGVWVCAPLFAPETVRRALRLPDSWIAQALLLLGYPAGEARRRTRLPLEAVTRYL